MGHTAEPEFLQQLTYLAATHNTHIQMIGLQCGSEFPASASAESQYRRQRGEGWRGKRIFKHSSNHTVSLSCPKALFLFFCLAMLWPGWLVQITSAGSGAGHIPSQEPAVCLGARPLGFNSRNGSVLLVDVSCAADTVMAYFSGSQCIVEVARLFQSHHFTFGTAAAHRARRAPASEIGPRHL